MNRVLFTNQLHDFQQPFCFLNSCTAIHNSRQLGHLFSMVDVTIIQLQYSRSVESFESISCRLITDPRESSLCDESTLPGSSNTA